MARHTMKTIDIASLGVGAWELTMFVSVVGGLILYVINNLVNIQAGHQPRETMQREIGREGAIDMIIDSSNGNSGINREPT